MGQKHDCLLRALAWLGGKPLRVNNVVFDVRRVHGRFKPHNAFFELKIGRPLIREKLVAVAHRDLVQLRYIIFDSIAIFGIPDGTRPIAGPVEPPLKRAQYAVGGAIAESFFPGLYPTAVKARGNRPQGIFL